jgi:hypothetical protein
VFSGLYRQAGVGLLRKNGAGLQTEILPIIEAKKL